MVAVPTRLTAATVRDRVLDRLGVGSAGQASPELSAKVLAEVASSQRTLCLSEDGTWLRPRRRQVVAVAQGRRWLPMPCLPEGLIRVTWQVDNLEPYALDSGFTAEDRPAVDQDQGAPAAFGIRTTTGVVSVTVVGGGSGYLNGADAVFGDPGGTGYAAVGTLAVTAGAITAVAITDHGADYVAAPAVSSTPGTGATLTAVLGEVYTLLLNTIPVVPGMAVIEYQDVPAITLADVDKLIIDEELVTLFACAAVAPHIIGLSAVDAAGYGQRGAAYLDRLRGALPSGGGFSLSPLRVAKRGR